jgi:hypothetical protein
MFDSRGLWAVRTCITYAHVEPPSGHISGEKRTATGERTEQTERGKANEKETNAKESQSSRRDIGGARGRETKTDGTQQRRSENETQ